MKRAHKFAVQKGWKLVIADLGVNPAHVLSLAGLPSDLFSRNSASLSPAEYFNLWRGLEEAAGDEALPLRVGESISVEAFDPPIFASLCSANLNIAMQRLSRYKRLIGPMILHVDVGLTKTWLELDCYGHDGAIPRSLGAMELVFFTQLARIATRKRIEPTDVSLVRLPDQEAEYKAFFGTPVRLGKSNRIAFSAQDAKQPFLTEDAGMWAFFESGLNKRLHELDAETSITQRVRSALLEMLPAGESSIEETAGKLAMSKRSLQRRLHGESSNYQAILNETRKGLAIHYLKRSEMPPGEISFLLGFQDSNSFLRAFKTWTGATPGEYRVRSYS